MSTESGPKYNFTIEQMVSIAQENILRDGGHRPTLIVKGSRSGATIAVDELGDTLEEHQKRLARIGFFLAQDRKIGVLRQAFFVSEGWMSIADEKPPATRPSQDPNRKEVLTISGLTVEDHRISMVVYEMVRD